jgi:hypothetical protein
VTIWAISSVVAAGARAEFRIFPNADR